MHVIIYVFWIQACDLALLLIHSYLLHPPSSPPNILLIYIYPTSVISNLHSMPKITDFFKKASPEEGAEQATQSAEAIRHHRA
jgi:hypothetical protein